MSRGAAWFRQKAGRRDANHAAIVNGLRALGHFVVETASVGGGVPDLCVFARPDWWRLSDDAEALAKLPVPTWLELKVAKGRVLKSQVAWRAKALAAGLRVATVRTLDEALEALT